MTPSVVLLLSWSWYFILIWMIVITILQWLEKFLLCCTTMGQNTDYPVVNHYDRTELENPTLLVFKHTVHKISSCIRADLGLFQYQYQYAVFPCMGIPIIKIRWSWDCLIFIIKILMLVRHLYIEMPLWQSTVISPNCWVYLIMVVGNIFQRIC